MNNSIQEIVLKFDLVLEKIDLIQGQLDGLEKKVDNLSCSLCKKEETDKNIISIIHDNVINEEVKKTTKRKPVSRNIYFDNKNETKEQFKIKI